MKKLLITISILLTMIVSQSFAFANPCLDSSFMDSSDYTEIAEIEVNETENEIVETLAPIARELASIEEAVLEEVEESTQTTASLFTIPEADDTINAGM
jgi:hypothetical protein